MFGFDLYAIIAGVIACIGALFVMIRKARQAGRNEVIADQQKQKEKQRAEFDKIDAGAPDLDASLDRLSKRAKHGKRPGAG